MYFINYHAYAYSALLQIVYHKYWHETDVSTFVAMGPMYKRIQHRVMNAPTRYKFDDLFMNNVAFAKKRDDQRI
jgi:hypothetical protein